MCQPDRDLDELFIAQHRGAPLSDVELAEMRTFDPLAARTPQDEFQDRLEETLNSHADALLAADSRHGYDEAVGDFLNDVEKFFDTWSAGQVWENSAQHTVLELVQAFIEHHKPRGMRKIVAQQLCQLLK